MTEHELAQMPNQPGVYAIVNRVNGKRYVGSSIKSLRSRCVTHRNCLIGSRHYNAHLQSAWDSYGEQAFEAAVLQLCESHECIEREQWWIDHLKAADRKHGYNSRPKAESNLGAKFGQRSEDARLRQAESLRKTWASGRFKRNITAETREKIGRAARGRKLSEDRRQAIIRALTGRVCKPETRAKIGAANAIALRGRKRPHSEETKEKLRIAHLGKKLSQEHKLKISLAKKGFKHKEETKEKMRLAALRRKIISETHLCV